ncbi:MAG: OmpA family protein [Fimbriimonadaceae bacterium]|nr:OmpA family protein [Fimbriimonadaceae bacterium]
MADGPIVVVKRKGRQAHGHHGGAWKVAYADFVTAMMAFFMVMWIMGMSQEERDIIQGYFNDPLGFTSSPPKAKMNILPDSGPTRSKGAGKGTEQQQEADAAEIERAASEVRTEVREDPALAGMQAEGSLDVAVTAEGLRISLSESESNSELFFKLGSAEIQPAARKVLGKLGPVLAKLGRPIMVDGHTDSRPLNLGGYDNFDLSHDRANAVRHVLLQGGVADRQVTAVRGFASRRPRVPEDPESFANRRVEILLPFQDFQEPVARPQGGPLGEEIEGVFRFPGQE